MYSPSRYICFNTDNWLNSNLFGRFVKLNYTAHRTVVGDSTRLHTKVLDSLHQIGYFCQAVQQAMMRMIM